jgi:hypothetical protein
VTGENGWRTRYVIWSSNLPMALLFIDMVANKIIIPAKFVISNILLILFYLFLTFIYQLIEELPPFSENLNWFCDRNIYYTLNKTAVLRYYPEDLPCNKDPDEGHPGYSCYR